MEDLGVKVKRYRLANRLTLKQLADKAGCTDAYLSQLERGKANPSIMILKKIATGLGLQVVDFFIEAGGGENDVVMKERDRVSMRFRRGDPKIQMLVRNIENKRMQPFYTTIEPGGGSRGAYTHIGEECGIVIQGVMELNLNGKVYRVKKNESFYFSSQETHSWGNPGRSRTIVIWVVSPPTF
jgi:transcriptional regulator with XRE-family HTH domain